MTVMGPEAKEQLEPLGAGRGRKDPPLEASEGDDPSRPLDAGLLAPRVVGE